MARRCLVGRPRVRPTRLSTRAAAHLEHVLANVVKRMDELERKLAAAAAAAAAAGPAVSVQQQQQQAIADDLAKYRRMLSLGIPSGAVRQCMIKDCKSPRALFPEDAPRPAARVVAPVAAVAQVANKSAPPLAFRVSEEQIRGIRSTLRKTPARSTHEPSLAKSSALRTPLRTLGTLNSPATAQNDAEFLKSALHNRFSAIKPLPLEAESPLAEFE